MIFFPILQLLPGLFPPPIPTNVMFFFSFLLKKKKKENQQNPIRQKVTKQNRKAQKPWSPFYVGQLLLCMSADWSVVDMLEKTDLLFLSRNQLQIVSWLEAGLCVCFRFSAEILFGLT